MIICKIFGHKIGNINTEKCTAICSRCNKKIDVSYDMYSGDTLEY